MIGKGGVGNDADIDAEFRQCPADEIARLAPHQFGEDLVGIDQSA